ncbi:hypothetical protein [Leeuwenhoekiella sp. NPDC079379]|uniref:hypothetical protein n=1 Tax=Leeuwenhoekiella sp. NPDC079379 TaxID=3364122 RepID=UPI0037C5AEE1
MKTNKHFYFLVSCLALIILMGCSDDDNVNVDSTPEFADLISEISSLPGQTFNLEAIINDPAGIKSIRLHYEPWFLDKTISKDSLPTSYTLNYSFKIPEDALNDSSHTISITAENAGGVTTQREVVVSLDADITAPQIAFVSPANASTVQIGEGDEILLDINLTDNKSLGEFKIESDILNETIELSEKSANYNKSINIEQPGLYIFNITLTDKAGNTVTSTRSVNVVDELNFLQMFLADQAEPSAFDNAISGYPYVADASTVSGEEGFVFTIKYFADSANKEVRFVAQQTGFGPFTFGGDANTPGNLVIGSDASVSPIIISEPGYYDIKMDLRDLTYTVNSITATAPANIASGFTGVYATGSGLLVDGVAITRFNPSQSSAPLKVDPDFQYRYSAELEFTAETGQFIFIGNQVNYSIFWRLNSGDIEAASTIVPQGGSNCAFSEQYEGTYKLTVDIFLNTMTITKT